MSQDTFHSALADMDILPDLFEPVYPAEELQWHISWYM